MTLQRRTAMKRSRKRLPARSAKRIDQVEERDGLRLEQLRLEPRCAAEIPGMCTTWASEVNELKRGGQRASEYLIRAHTESLCHHCHAWITVHPDWARHHGHQVMSEANEEEFALARRVRRYCTGHATRCLVDHREEHR